MSDLESEWGTMNGRRQPSFVDTGEMLQAFAAMVRNGLILLIGDVASQYQKEVVAGMDLSTRLVINLLQNSTDAGVGESMSSDLRVVVHRQSPEDFLMDVSRHPMDMVVTDARFSVQLAEQIKSILVAGGYWIILNADRTSELVDNAFFRLNLGAGLLLVKKPVPLANVRRGGRRSRRVGNS